MLERIHPADARTLLLYDVEYTDYSGSDVWGGIAPDYVPNEIYLGMNCMDHVAVGSFVSCGMRSDHMDVLHQRTVNFPMP